MRGTLIRTTVTSRTDKVDDHVWSFLNAASADGRKIIGLDTEWKLVLDSDSGFDSEVKSKSNLAILVLCDGNSCLIIQMPYLDSVPTSLFTFLRLPNITFVGVGIKENMAKFEKEYGIGCKNAVELGPLAAAVMMMPRPSACGVDRLALEVNGIFLHDQRPISTIFNDWGAKVLSKKHAKLAAINAYAYYRIGNKLSNGME
ncbi:hypothetical protein L6164_010321 [Bauhinia variegata]|uniref:Uncharacterized protein n=1 Tax=Bauhinia variegata TaxID=167791 RepID=A0ACB9PMW4_BAUVA|nr:hypothetical protein L6164_010321 [Bauhinia variegata]